MFIDIFLMSEGVYQSIYDGEQCFHPDFFTSGVLLEQLLLFFSLGIPYLNEIVRR